jgi:hypothetical protein
MRARARAGGRVGGWVCRGAGCDFVDRNCLECSKPTLPQYPDRPNPAGRDSALVGGKQYRREYRGVPDAGTGATLSAAQAARRTIDSRLRRRLFVCSTHRRGTQTGKYAIIGQARRGVQNAA